MSLVANVNGFSNIGIPSTGVQVEEGPPIFDYDSIKKTALQNLASSTQEKRYVVSHP